MPALLCNLNQRFNLIIFLEVIMPVNSIVPILDQSGSMGSEGKLPAAQTDICTFINIMQTTDRLAVVAFSDNSSEIYPGASSPLVAIAGQSTLDSACQAVLATTALDMTNIAAAIAQAHGLLASAATPRAMVLASDGIWNAGGDPTQNLPTDIPIYTIALGNTFNPSFLQTIATQTGGQYNYEPDAFQLAEI
jgi:Mg-chelatase subunit ChlD